MDICWDISFGKKTIPWSLLGALADRIVSAWDISEVCLETGSPMFVRLAKTEGFPAGEPNWSAPKIST